MMKPYNTRLCASAAIAAALALTSTPLLAQMAPAPTTPATTTVPPDPVLVIPTAPTTPPAQPTIVLPTELPEAAPPPAAAVPVEPTAARATTTPTQTTTTRAATPPAERAAPRVTAAPAQPERVAAEPETVVTEEPVEQIAPEPVAAPVAETAPEPATASDTPGEGTGFLLALLGGLAVLALAIWGFVAIGRRKPIDRKAAKIVERPVAPRPAIAAPVMVESEPVAPVAVAPSVSPLRTATPAPSLAHSGAAVPLPRTMPATFEERDALIRRMIEAKPDRANPFTSPLQRRKRAKLILQSLGRDFSDREPWIDLSQYPANWPELARRNTAAA